MKIAVIGAGGVGGYFGAKLAKAGLDVTFLARGKHLNAPSNNGLTIKSILGDFKVEKLRATDKITEIDKPDFAFGYHDLTPSKWRFGCNRVIPEDR